MDLTDGGEVEGSAPVLSEFDHILAAVAREDGRSGLFQKACVLGLRTLDGPGRIAWFEAIADGRFAKAKEGRGDVGRTGTAGW